MSTHAAEEAEHDEPASGRSRSGRRVAVLVVLTLVGAAAAIAAFGPKPRVPEGTLIATADDEEASGYRQEGPISHDTVLAASATKLQSNCNVTAVHTSASSSGDRMFARTLAIYNFSDDLLMQRIGLAVFERLRDEGRFQQLQYLPAGDRLPDGQRLPEVFVTLEKQAWEESGLPGNRRFQGEIVVTAGDQFRRSNRSHHASLSPPQLQFGGAAEIDYTATQTGIETSGARYQAVSRDLAKEIGERLTKLLNELTSKHGTPGDLPEAFYPSYVEPPAFDFVAALDAEKWVDGPEFMSPTVTVWESSGDQTPSEVITAVSRSLTEAGWKVSEAEADSDYMRATDGSQLVVVFRDNAGRMIDAEHADAPTRMFIVYRRGMPTSDTDAAVRTMFEEGADESSLLMFQNAWYRQRDLVDAYFANRNPTAAESWLQLARLRKKSDPDGAREALLRANALRWVVDQKSPDSSMKKLAEELGMEELPQQISHEMMRVLGFSDLSGPGEIEVTVRENEPAVIWLGEENQGEENQEQTWLLLTAVRGGRIDPQHSLRVQMLRLGEGTWSHSNQTGGDLTTSTRPAHTQRVGAGQELQVFSEPIDRGRYRLRLHRSEPPIVE